ncbi:PREDICTED: serine carboxypeptidase-like 51 [Nelumbo nucifera]|uniref:Carboxypeptidase n=1 Tax=Nelumbo nucifera TaxID=4432 RepID=A0A1U7YRM3_NELNU|nr:PREDICTED: serine carboxypeptidase-like 51 [Nelumbo nucifera]
MEKFCFLLLFALAFLFNGGFSVTDGTEDGSELWGYVEVRPKAHMFWWYYKSPNRVEDPFKPWPIILWLQGGPGGSGVGIGNFQEVGPLDTNLMPRNSTWLRVADLLFVDNPVGTGFSYVEDEKACVKTDEEAAIDLTTLLKELFNKNENLQNNPLYIVAESYGGKFAVTLGLSAFQAIAAGELKLKLGGVALGDSWISPEDFVFAWAPLLKDLSRLDNNGVEKANSIAQLIKQQIENGQYKDATSSWSELESMIIASSNRVDFYNFLLDAGRDPLAIKTMESSAMIAVHKYSKYLSSNKFSGDGVDLGSLMNGVIRKKLKIIPNDVKWGGQSEIVFSALDGDFMKPRINEVDELLAKGVNVTIYNGQVDLICATKGTQAWVEKLKWEGLKSFLGLDRTPLYCGDDKTITRGFTKSYRNLHFYWVLEAGHFVPVDQPCIALDMVRGITQSPISSY